MGPERGAFEAGSIAFRASHESSKDGRDEMIYHRYSSINFDKTLVNH